MTEERQFQVGEIEFVCDYRSGAGTPFVFLPGGTATVRAFDDVIGAVPPEREMYCFDLRGHGRSGWSQSKDYRVENFVEDTVRILDEVTGPAVMVGWSLGGVAAVLAAGLRPDLAKGVLLADASPYLAIDEDRFINVPMMPFVQGLAEVVRDLPERGVDWAVSTLGSLSIGPVPAREIMSDAFLREYVAEAAPMDPDLVGSLFSRTAGYDVDAVLREVVCPVRLVHGDVAKGSVVTPEDVVRYAECCVDFAARYEPTVGHGVHRKPVEDAFRADIESMAALVL